MPEGKAAIFDSIKCLPPESKRNTICMINLFADCVQFLFLRLSEVVSGDGSFATFPIKYNLRKLYRKCVKENCPQLTHCIQ